MRLRYLHLPRYGPLRDAAVLFGKEERLAELLEKEKDRAQGSLNFLVGVNGTGKSSVLRAIYQTFRSLHQRQEPAQPVTLAWDRRLGKETLTAVFHLTHDPKRQSLFLISPQVPKEWMRSDWQTAAERLAADPDATEFFGTPQHLSRGRGQIHDSLLFAHLPKRLLAYTSGAEDLWAMLEHPDFHPLDEMEGQYRPEDDRPMNWTIERELSSAQPERITSILRQSVVETNGEGSEWLRVVNPEAAQSLVEQLRPLSDLSFKIDANSQLHPESVDENFFRISDLELRLSGMILAFWQAAREFRALGENHEIEALRSKLIARREKDDHEDDGRIVLSKIDWFWPTHLSLTYHDAAERVKPMQRIELLCLLALADEVVTQPQGRQRAVISLGPVTGGVNLSERLDEAFPNGWPSEVLKLIAERIDGCRTGAEAVLRLFSEDDQLESTPWDVFLRLRDWSRSGLLEDINLTVKRLDRPRDADSDADDVIVAYDQMSDGEQMLLCRMGLLFLMRGQDDSLLLLDEPETHFNDRWKREIVDMVYRAILQRTRSNVLISTHTSIALTDAFGAEVNVLTKREGRTEVFGVTGGLFGTDPGEVNMNLFGADSSIGSRAIESLNKLLRADWKDREDELEALLDVLGSSFHRAELRAELNRLRTKANATPSD